MYIQFQCSGKSVPIFPTREDKRSDLDHMLADTHIPPVGSEINIFVVNDGVTDPFPYRVSGPPSYKIVTIGGRAVMIAIVPVESTKPKPKVPVNEKQ